jgi:iron-sulfur cluster repair protein YtfE (RIC family)
MSIAQMGWTIPSSLRDEHDQLHAELEAATTAPGRLGASARRVAAALHPHFVREEEIALPPLGLLEPLTQGPPTPDMRAILPLTDALKRELPTMLQEHREIGKAVDELARVAREEGVPAYADLSARIRAHALTEEQILYPAAILAGEFVRQNVPDSDKAAG